VVAAISTTAIKANRAQLWRSLARGRTHDWLEQLSPERVTLRVQVQSISLKELLAWPTIRTEHGCEDIDVRQAAIGSYVLANEGVCRAHFVQQRNPVPARLYREKGNPRFRHGASHHADKSLEIVQDIRWRPALGQVVVACVDDYEPGAIGQNNPRSVVNHEMEVRSAETALNHIHVGKIRSNVRPEANGRASDKEHGTLGGRIDLISGFELRNFSLPRLRLYNRGCPRSRRTLGRRG
jgi:hypothetical protein